MTLTAGWWTALTADPIRIYFAALALYVVWLVLHFGVRRIAASSLLGAAERRGSKLGVRGSLRNAFAANTRFWRSIFSRRPVGWSRRNRRRVQRALEDADRYVQDLNDRFTNPAGNVPLTVEPELQSIGPSSEAGNETGPAKASAAD
jgi:hypothetical protein